MVYGYGHSFSFDFKPNGIHLVQNRKENCHHVHIPFDMKGKGNIVFSVHSSPSKCTIKTSELIRLQMTISKDCRRKMCD